MRTALALLLPTAFAAATACAVPARIVFSKRAPDADTAPRRVFILSRLLEAGGPSFGPVFAKAFEGRFDAALRRCGVQTGGYASTGMELGDDLDRPANAYRPDAVLIVRMSHGTVDQFGALLNGTIEITVYGGTAGVNGARVAGQKPKMLWRGAAIFAHGGLGFTALASKAEAFADDMSNKMKDDGFFPGCARVGPKDLPAVVSPVESASYQPGSKLTACGGVTLAAMTYLPAQLAEARAAEARRSKEGPNTAVNNAPPARTPHFGPERDQLAGDGRTRFSPALDEYVRAALAAELRMMGLDTGDGRRMLRGDIQDAAIDGSSWGYRVSLRVAYELTETSTGRLLFSVVKAVSTPASSRPMLEAEALNQAIRASAEALVQDPEFAQAVR